MTLESHPSEVFKVLGVETRVKIIELLKSQGPLGSKNIAGILCMTPSAASQHLRVLRQAGLVRSQRRGYCIPYSIDEKALGRCCCVLTEVCTCGCKANGADKEERNNESLASLREYERELEKQLQNVRKRISEFGPQNRER
ncbi:MAG: winged helix-turn-helix transcriptional regulator [Candidatus Coatesbacteria bacterium]|nr:winged helix-turn-helix transcriptional regulator [Candidatus Coatesbacteria bacterium]